MESDYDYWWWNTTKIIKNVKSIRNHLNALGI